MTVEYEKLADEINEFLPNQWKKVVLFVAYTGGSYSMKYYYSFDGVNYKDCFSQPGVDRLQLIKLFMKLDKDFSAERDNLSNDRRWTVMTFTMCSDGRFEASYDYEDVSQNLISYEKAWENTYLR